jgi:hypothetical protein
LHDAVAGERVGTPSVAIITTGFVDGAELMSGALGLPGYEFAIITHPISSATDEELRTKAADTLRQAAPLLLRAD